MTEGENVRAGYPSLRSMQHLFCSWKFVKNLIIAQLYERTRSAMEDAISMIVGSGVFLALHHEQVVS